MSKKDEVTGKWRNYIMTKMKKICEFNAYNRARMKTQNTCEKYKYKNVNMKGEKKLSSRNNKHVNF